MSKKIERKVIGHVGVDSGQILVCDPCYIDSQWQQVEFPDDRDKLSEHIGEFSYAGACEATLESKDLGGQLNYEKGHAGAGVAVSSGYGDGYYPVIAEYIDEGMDKRIARITIDFMGTYTQEFMKKTLKGGKK